MARTRLLAVGLAVSVGASFAGAASVSASGPEGATLVGVDAQSGRSRWSAAAGGEQAANLGVVYVSEGVVLALRQRCLSADHVKYRSGDIQTLAFDATTGRQLWARRNAAVAYPGYASFGYKSNDGVVPIQTTTGKLEGVSLRSGKVRWRRPAAMPATSTGNAAFGGQFGVMGTIGGLLITSNLGIIQTTGGEPRLEAWRLRAGRQEWSRSLASDSVNVLASDGHDLFALRQAAAEQAAPGVFGERIETLSLDNGEVASALDLGPVSSPYVPTHLVVTEPAFVTGAWSNEGKTTAFDRASGAARWQRTGFLQSSVGDTVFVSDPGMIVALDASTGAQRWQLRGRSVQPSGNGTVVVSDFDPYEPGEGTMSLVDAATGAARWSRSSEPLGFGGTTRGISILVSQGCAATSSD